MLCGKGMSGGDEGGVRLYALGRMFHISMIAALALQEKTIHALDWCLNEDSATIPKNSKRKTRAVGNHQLHRQPTARIYRRHQHQGQAR